MRIHVRIHVSTTSSLKSAALKVQSEVIMLGWLSNLSVFKMTGFVAVVISLLGVIVPEAV